MRIHGEQGHLTENDLALHELTWFLYIFPSGMTVSLTVSQSVWQAVRQSVSETLFKLKIPSIHKLVFMKADIGLKIKTE